MKFNDIPEGSSFVTITATEQHGNYVIVTFEDESGRTAIAPLHVGEPPPLARALNVCAGLPEDSDASDVHAKYRGLTLNVEVVHRSAGYVNVDRIIGSSAPHREELPRAAKPKRAKK